MVLSNEFTVGAEVDDVWAHLLDMEGVANCLPGATIEATDEENTYNGSMRVRMGPMTVDYKGIAKLAEVDEENHTATISLSAREKKGQGTAMATIKNRLEPSDGGTRVFAETDLHITGPQAQFGRGVLEDVGGRVLSEFSSRLEQQIVGGEEGAGGADEQSGDGQGTRAGGSNGRPQQQADDSLDLGAAIAQTQAGRYIRIAAIVLAALVALRIVLGRR
jgi:uncharacterized protein